MTHQHRHQEMRPSIVGQRSCRSSGIVNLTVWYVTCLSIGVCIYLYLCVFNVELPCLDTAYLPLIF